MKLFRTKIFNRIHWIVFLIPFSIWLYVELFVGAANTRIDDTCYLISVVFLATIIARKMICEFWDFANEPRFLLDTDSQCYGCQYYKKKAECIQDHIDDDFDDNMGACDVDCICANGSMNTYRN